METALTIWYLKNINPNASLRELTRFIEVQRGKVAAR